MQALNQHLAEGPSSTRGFSVRRSLGLKRKRHHECCGIYIEEVKTSLQSEVRQIFLPLQFALFDLIVER